MGDDQDTTKLLDAAALELAQAALAEEPELADRAEELAECIRDATDDWIMAARNELPGEDGEAADEPERKV